MSGALLNVVVDAFVSVAQPGSSDVLPASAELDAQLTDDPATWRSLIVHLLDNYIDPLLFAGGNPTNSQSAMDGLPGTLVRGAPDGAAVPWNNEARLRQVLTQASAVAFTPPATNSLPRASVDVFDLKLHSFGALSISDAFDTYLQYVAADRSLAPDVASTKIKAKQKVLDLVAFEAFLVRLSSALLAAEGARVSLAEALALYRVEGDLLAPMSDAYISERLPRLREKLSGGALSLGDDTFAVLETMDRGLWSYPFKTLAYRVLAMTPSAVPRAGEARERAEDQVKSFALLHWMFVIGGLDILAATTSYPTVVPFKVRARVVSVTHEYRLALGIHSDLAEREADFDNVYGNLSVKWPDTMDGRVVVSPREPIPLAALAATTALLVLRRDHAHGGGPSIQPPAGLEYLAYNAQATHVPKERDQFVFILASAAVAAANCGSASFSVLKSKLAPLGLPLSLPTVPANGVSFEHAVAFAKLTSTPTKFLDDPSNAALLADFVLRAEIDDWRAWDQHRGNLARYRKLLSFYGALLS